MVSFAVRGVIVANGYHVSLDGLSYSYTSAKTPVAFTVSRIDFNCCPIATNDIYYILEITIFTAVSNASCTIGCDESAVRFI